MLNQHQKSALIIMRDAYNDYIGGLENTMMDNPPDSDEYQSANATLRDHDMLLDIIYDETIREANRIGSAIHTRFAGKAWLRERIAKRLRADGYPKLIEEGN